MKKTLKTLSALLTYPTEDLQHAVPVMQTALDEEGCLPEKHRDWLDRILEELATGDLFDCQERYVLLFDRTRSLSLHLFEHVHGESRDRGQAMVDLQQLYETNGLYLKERELPDFIPLFIEFLSTLSIDQAQPLLAEPAHIFEAIRMRLEKRKSTYSSVFSALQILVDEKPNKATVDAMLAQPDPDPNDLEALDAAWEDEEVKFGPDAMACGKDNLSAKLRAGQRLAPGVEPPEPKRPIITYTSTNRA
ncbi:MAG: nitrate reductase molybdenum cofactor assembly chaperone [Hyphomicrobiaceae bacterium]